MPAKRTSVGGRGDRTADRLETEGTDKEVAMTIRQWRWTMGAGAGAGLLLGLAAGTAEAGAKVTIKDDAYLDLGFRLNYVTMLTQSDIDGDGTWDTSLQHRVRRGRLRVKAVANPWFSAFVQTEVADDEVAAGVDMRLFDAYLTVVADPWAQFYIGQHIAPVSRQMLTGSNAHLAMDRPGITTHSPNWGNRSVYRFSTATLPGSSAGISTGEAPPRDVGITLFGAGAIGEQASLKYYLGTYNGVVAEGENSERITARAQVNFFEAEDGYSNSSTYLGTKKTVGLGASLDLMPKIANVEDENGADDTADYTGISADAFLEWPVGAQTLSAEVGIVLPDFGDFFANATGTGIYGQAGLLVAQVWQPWAEFETFASDADDDRGSYNAFRLGITRYIAGQAANVKLGVEVLSAETPLIAEGTESEDSALTAALGFFTTW